MLLHFVRHVFLALLLLLAMVSWAQKPNLKGGLRLMEDTGLSYRLEIKFKDNIQPYLNSQGELDLKTINTIGKSNLESLVPLGFHYSALISNQSKDPFTSKLQSLMQVTGLSPSKHDLLKIAEQLEAHPFIEYVDLVPEKIIPPPIHDYPADVTPDLSSLQDYLGENPGVNAKYVWSLNVFGEGIRVADIEYDWDMDHEDLVNNFDDSFLPTYLEYKDHGTAVAGMLAGKNNNFGITGAAYKATFRGYGEFPTGRTAAILEAVAWLRAGDVLIIEMQSPILTETDYGPADYSKSVWDAILAATDKGIHVIAAAGNGAVNLDDLSEYMNRGDNGSILVGAGNNNNNHQILSYSSYGSRVNLQGWGSPVIVSSGFGNLARYDDDDHRSYTNTFSGTSSATAMVASAAILIQSWAKKELNQILTPRQLRTLLMETGNPQGGINTHKQIGPCPNILNALNKLSQTQLEVAVNEEVVLDEGSSKGITTKNIFVSSGGLNENIKFTITNAPVNGRLVLKNNTNSSIAAFSQQDIINGEVVYIHNGTNTIADQISFRISNSYTQIEDVTLQITILPIDNDPPIITVNTGLTLNEGTFGILSENVLSAEDTEASLEDIRFIITSSPQHGIICFQNDHTSISSFCQQDIVNNKVIYKHDDSNSLQDTFSFTLTDGTNIKELLHFSFIINPIDDDPPVLKVNKFLISGLDPVLITPENLWATDTDSNDEMLEYTITTPASFGYLATLTDPENSILHFTNSQIKENTIQFIPANITGDFDSFQFIVSDGKNELSGQSFQIRFDLVTDIEQPIISTILFPNPATSVLSIKSNQNIEHITLINLQGKIVWETANNSNKVELDIRHLVPSLYFVSMKIDNQVVTRKIFIQPF